MAVIIYNKGLELILDGTIDLVTDVFKAALVTSTYTPVKTHDFMSEVTNELNGTGYASGFASADRVTLAGKAQALDDGNNQVEWDMNDIVFAGPDTGETAAAVVIYKHLTSDAASHLIAYIDSGGFPIVVNGGTLTVAPSATEGLIKFAQA